MAVVFEVAGVKRQLRMFSRQLHAAESGVGGNVVDARKLAVSAGQAG
jgi:hypothetical protein